MHDAEVEYFAEKFSMFDVWKSFRDTLLYEESRRKKIIELISKDGKELPPFRERIKTEEALKAFYEKGSQWLQAFIEDENARVYISKGVQWYSPDKNQWKWIEIQVLQDKDDIPKAKEVKHEITKAPEFGQYIEFIVGPNIERNNHTEYLIEIKTNIKEYYPYFNHYVLRRYNEFKAFHQQLKMYMYAQNIEIRLPDIPSPQVLGRKSKSTVAKRTAIFKALLDFVASENRLRTCHLVLEFFGINPMEDEWKYIVYADEPVRFK